LPALLVVVTMLSACSVPALDLNGKQCPCSDNYVCVAGTCHSSPIDAADDETCLGAPGAELYSFAGTFDWTHAGGSWSGAGKQITQTQATGNVAVAYEGSVTATSYRVTTTVSTPSASSKSELGVALSVSNSGEDLYECMLAPANNELAIRIDAGGNRSTLSSVAIQVGTLAAVTMEANITTAGGNPTMSCCLRGVASAKLIDVVDENGTIANGPPGLATYQADAAFDSFIVTAAP
jgi:hypothetical protein